jgi:hypothetical protein
MATALVVPRVPTLRPSQQELRRNYVDSPQS